MQVLLFLAVIGLSLATNGTPPFTYNLSYSAPELDPCWKWSNQQLETTEDNCRACVLAEVYNATTGEAISCSYCPLQSICLTESIAADYIGGGCWSIPINNQSDCAPPGTTGGIRAVSIYSAIIFIGLVAMGGKFWKTSADFKKRVAEAEREDEEPAPQQEEKKPKKKTSGKAAQRKTPKKEETASSSSSSPASPSKETSGKDSTSASSAKESSSVSSSDSS